MKKGFAVAIVLLSVLLVQLGISGLAAERAEMISGVYQPVEAERAEMSTGAYQPVDTERAEMSHAVYQPVEKLKAEETPSVAVLSEGTIEVRAYPSWIPEMLFAAIESPTYTISGPVTYSRSGWSQSNVPPGTYTLTYGSISGYKSPPSKTKTLSVGGSITFTGHYPLKKMAGDSFDFGDGYILLIREVNPKVGEVSIELQLDNHTVDDKTLRKNEEYYVPFNEYSLVDLVISFNVEDIYHDITGDYVDLWFPFPVAPAVPHSNLIIASDPQGADILIDGDYVGKTPKTIIIADLEMHSLCAELSGYEDVETTFNFESHFGEDEMLIPLNKIQPTPTHTPPVTPTLVPHTHSPTPPPAETLVPHTYSPTPSTPEPTPEMAVPHTYSPPPTPPGFLAISFILAILCVYWIMKRKHS